MVKTTKTLKNDIPRHSGYQDAKETGICPHEPTFGEGRIMRISLHFFSTSDHYQLYPDLRQFKHSGFEFHYLEWTAIGTNSTLILPCLTVSFALTLCTTYLWKVRMHIFALSVVQVFTAPYNYNCRLLMY